MSPKKEKISQRLTVMVGRLRELETRKVEPHERPIVEVGIMALRAEVSKLGKEMDR